jgi:enoyl-CoA hydratase/carnithine racemase
MCGDGVVNDMVLTGRVMDAEEALRHGVVSRVVAESELDDVVHAMAEQIVSTPTITVKLYREVLRHLSLPPLRASMADELTYQTTLNKSDDFAEFKAARSEGRDPRYSGS